MHDHVLLQEQGKHIAKPRLTLKVMPREAFQSCFGTVAVAELRGKRALQPDKRECNPTFRTERYGNLGGLICS